MVMLAICRIQRPVSLEFGASGVWGGVCVCGGTSRAIASDMNLAQSLVSCWVYSGFCLSPFLPGQPRPISPLLPCEE